jgi:hypothetical protein
MDCKSTHGNPFRYCACGWMEKTKSDPDAFLKKAKDSVVSATYNGGLRLRYEDIYIVWFVKVLGNWKALISTDVVDGAYWEVTYNGAKSETYVDAYTKSKNTVIPDRV